VHIVIMGCGRVGSALAQTLEQQGHTVAVIDQDPTAFRRLGSGFGGRRVTGSASTRTPCARRASSDADAFAAVSSGDNSNIIAARVARETFGIEQVVARIYDPRRAEVYQRLGIPTVATVKLDRRPDAAPAAARRRRAAVARPVRHDPLAEVHASRAWIGQRISRLQEETGAASRSSTGSARGSCPPARRCCRRATWCT
jgi:trk system potassium uptake protein TrkA